MPSPEKPEVEKPAPPVEKPESKATPEPKPKATPEPKATPQPKSKATPTPRVKKDAPPTVKSAPVPEPPAGSDPEKVERWKFSEAKRKAMDDSEVAGLKNKADTAPEGDEARKAMRAYNKALFDKMRKLDPALKDRIDGTEAAVMKRLGE